MRHTGPDATANTPYFPPSTTPRRPAPPASPTRSHPHTNTPGPHPTGPKTQSNQCPRSPHATAGTATLPTTQQSPHPTAAAPPTASATCPRPAPPTPAAGQTTTNSSCPAPHSAPRPPAWTAIMLCPQWRNLHPTGCAPPPHYDAHPRPPTPTYQTCPAE